jgi:hypothetical protein
MRINAYLLILLTLAIACKGEMQKNTATETKGIVEQENEITAETAVATAVNIKDIFLLLPDDVFPMEAISVANRKLLLNSIGEDNAYDISPTPIDVCDVKNGYLSLTGMQTGWEMCYWNLKDGRKLVAINKGTESGSEIRVFFYQNGELTEDYNYQLGGNQKFTLSDFVDVSQLSSDTRKFAEQQFAKGNYQLYYQLPRNGTSIKISMDVNEMTENPEDYDVFYEASKDLTLKWENEKWIK